MKKCVCLRVLCAMAAVLLLGCCTACTVSDSDRPTTATTSTQNKAMENVPGKNTGDGQDKTDNPGGSSANPSEDPVVEKAERDVSKAMYDMPSNIPPLSMDGIKGMVKQVYYTTDGGLAVTLNLSNGTPAEQRVLSLSMRLTNDKDVALIVPVTVEPENCRVAAGGYSELYVLVEAASVLVADDALTMPIPTLTFTSEATSGDTVTEPDENAAYGEKDPAVGMAYYENYSNLPELSADAVKATVVRARYTNDGSMTVALMFSNGATVDRTVTTVTVTVRNADTGVVIASQRFDWTGDPCTVKAGAYEERHVTIDQTNVPMKYDKLNRLATTVEIG